MTVNGAIYNLFDKQVEQDTHNTLVEGRRLWTGATTTF
jgi:outer membrane receptor for ferrienterochelin and colicins